MADVLELPVQERLKLVEDNRDTIADVPEALDLTEEDKRLIDERLNNAGTGPKRRSALAGGRRSHYVTPVSYTFIIRPQAETDLFAWYERRKKGLGCEFLAEIRAASAIMFIFGRLALPPDLQRY